MQNGLKMALHVHQEMQNNRAEMPSDHEEMQTRAD